MVSKKFDAVEFSTAYLATVKLYKGPYVVYENQPGICHTHKSDRVIASIRSFARSRGERLNENRLKDVLDEIAAFAFEDAQPVVVHNRVAPYLEGYIYNLGNGRFLQNMGTGISVVSTLPEGECKKICVTGILTNLLKGQQNAIIRRTHRSTAGGLLQP